MKNQNNLLCKAGKNSYLPYIDGLRGVAVLLVVLGHVFYEYYIFKIGWVGLNLFFVLSGYLITRSLLQYENYSAGNYFINFYGRRMLRIFPLYYGMLALFFFLLPAIGGRFQTHFSELGEIQINYWLYLSNWQIILHGLPEQPVFFHFWSLAVEEQFYFIWPILFFLCTSSKSRYVLVSMLLVISITVRISSMNPLHAYLSSLTAAEPLLLGSLLSIFQAEDKLKKANDKLAIASVLSIIFLGLVFIRNSDLHITNDWLIKYGYSAINIIICAALCSVLIGSSWGTINRRLFSMKWLMWIGKYSYGIYVFHWIILKVFVYKFESFLIAIYTPDILAYLVARTIGIAMTVLLSYFSYHYYEKHFLLQKKHFSGEREWSWEQFKTYFSSKSRAILVKH